MVKEKNRSVFYVYLSIVIHLYAVLLIVFVINLIDKGYLDTFLNRMKPKAAKSNMVIENIVVNTMSSYFKTPEKGKISDKPNIDRGILGKNNVYNYLNPDPKDFLNYKQASKDLPADKGDKGQVLPDQTGKESGDYRTSFYDPALKPDVSMTSEGDISLATVPVEYASYFLNMQKKIGENWNKFYPVFQYYQGIIKPGKVIVNFRIDNSGNIITPKIIESYGYEVLDQSCLNAVIYSKSFDPLPDSLKKDNGVSVDFTFVYLANR